MFFEIFYKIEDSILKYFFFLITLFVSHKAWKV